MVDKDTRRKMTKLHSKRSSRLINNKSVQTEPVNPVMNSAEVLGYMKDQLASGSPNYDGIQKIMDITFDHRRHFIINQLPKVRAIFDIYPALFEISQVLREFHFIKRRKLEDFVSNIKACSKALIQFTEPSYEVMGVIAKKRKGCTNTEILDYIHTAGAILVLPRLVQNDLEGIIVFNTRKPTGDTPIIICPSPLKDCLNRDVKFYVYVERVKLCETCDLREAFLALCAAYYIFNIAYSKECEETFAVVERFFLQIDPEMTEPTENVTEIIMLLLHKKD